MRITPMLPALRRVAARRPWLQWAVITTVALAVAATVADTMAAVDAEREEWGESVAAWVAAADHDIGDVLAAEVREVPLAVLPDDAVGDDPSGALARQSIGRGEIVTTLDAVDGDRGIAPAAWLVAPVRESPPSGVGVGERVQVVSDGFVMAAEGIVVGFHDDVTLVAVDPSVAPLLPAASDTAHVALLRRP
jgi:hypothetical protein